MIRNRHIGFVFQLHHLLPQLTVFENVLVPTLADGTAAKGEDVQTRARRLLAGDSFEGDLPLVLDVVSAIAESSEVGVVIEMDLTNKPASGKGALTQNTSDLGMIPRAEVARLIVQSLGNGATFGSIYSAFDKK